MSVEPIQWVLLCKMNDDPADQWEESVHSPKDGFTDRSVALRACAKLRKYTEQFFYCVAPRHNCETYPKTGLLRLKAGFES